MGKREQIEKLCRRYSALINQLTLVAENEVPEGLGITDVQIGAMEDLSEVTKRSIAKLIGVDTEIVDRACVAGLNRRLDMIYWEDLQMKVLVLADCKGTIID